MLNKLISIRNCVKLERRLTNTSVPISDEPLEEDTTAIIYADNTDFLLMSCNPSNSPRRVEDLSGARKK